MGTRVTGSVGALDVPPVDAPGAEVPTDLPATSGRSGDAGAVTVEAALGICSVAAVFALVLSGVGVLVGQLRCTDAATEVARLVSRGERARAAEVVARTAPRGAALDVAVRGDAITAEVSAEPLGGLLPGKWLHGRAFAFAEPDVPAAAGGGA